MKATGFDHFLNKVVSVTESESEMDFLDEKIKISNYTIQKDDSVIKQLETEVNAKGHLLRVWLPNSAGTMDVKNNRLNACITKQADGTFAITELYFG